MYKVFIDEHPIIITDAPEYNHCTESINISPQISYAQLLDMMRFEGKSLHVDSNLLPESLPVFSDHLFIRAAGGVVWNQNKQILFIHRLKKWDLPKGKMEKGEEAPLTALREVSEECGIPEPDIIRWIQATYHTYSIKGQYVLKRTDWFEMISSFTGELTPQLEESIDKVTWLDWPNTSEFIFKNTYETIKEVLKAIS